MAYHPPNPVFGHSYANTSTSSEGIEKTSDSSCVSSHAGGDVSTVKVHSNLKATSSNKINSPKVWKGWRHFEESVGDKNQDLDEDCSESTTNNDKMFLTNNEHGAIPIYRSGCAAVFDTPDSEVRKAKSPRCAENRVTFCEITATSQVCTKPQQQPLPSTPTNGVGAPSQRLYRQNIIASISRRFEAMSLRSVETPREEMIRSEDFAESENWPPEEVEWLKTRSRRRSSAVFFYKSPAGKSPKVRELVTALNNRSASGTPAPNSSISARDFSSAMPSSQSATSPSSCNEINSAEISGFVAFKKKPTQKPAANLSATPNGSDFLRSIERIGRRANMYSPSYVDFAQSFIRRKSRVCGVPKRLDFERK